MSDDRRRNPTDAVRPAHACPPAHYPSRPQTPHLHGHRNLGGLILEKVEPLQAFFPAISGVGSAEPPRPCPVTAARYGFAFAIRFHVGAGRGLGAGHSPGSPPAPGPPPSRARRASGRARPCPDARVGEITWSIGASHWSVTLEDTHPQFPPIIATNNHQEDANKSANSWHFSVGDEVGVCQLATRTATAQRAALARLSRSRRRRSCRRRSLACAPALHQGSASRTRNHRPSACRRRSLACANRAIAQAKDLRLQDGPIQDVSQQGVCPSKPDSCCESGPALRLAKRPSRRTAAAGATTA